MNFDTGILEEYYQNGLLNKQTHPTLPLSIWNYSEKVQYQNLWDDVLIHCRGLVTDENGSVVAKPFKKFFNIEENKHTPSSNFSIWEKVDGSLGIMFFYDDEWHICTRGSFTSEQAVKAKEMLSDYGENWKSHFDKNCTYLFEIIYRENKIVIDYDREGLTLLGAVNNSTGEEFTPEEIDNTWFPYPERFLFLEGDTFQKLKDMNSEGQEGFVVHFDNGQKCKIKFEWYLTRHKIAWALTNRLIWEYLSDGNIDELIAEVPDEFYSVVHEEVNALKNMYHYLELSYKWIFTNLADPLWTRKEFAVFAKAHKHPQILFKMYDSRPYDDTIWKILYPSTVRKILTKNVLN